MTLSDRGGWRRRVEAGTLDFVVDELVAALDPEPWLEDGEPRTEPVSSERLVSQVGEWTRTELHTVELGVRDVVVSFTHPAAPGRVFTPGEALGLTARAKEAGVGVADLLARPDVDTDLEPWADLG